MHLVHLQFAQSQSYADRLDGNCSPYTLSAIPLLMSSIRCLVVEYASFPPVDSVVLKALTKPADFEMVLDHYGIEGPLRTDALLLQETRNEIVHPAHRPSGTQDNWPDYLRTLKERGLLQSTGSSKSDYIFFSQIQSHRLLIWSWQTVRDIAERILRSDLAKAPVLGDFLGNYDPVGRS
jgi:hypothetical protein